jgi:hypothetical protein
MARPRKTTDDAEPTWRMVITAPFWTLGSDRIARQGDIIDADERLRTTLLFKDAGRDA